MTYVSLRYQVLAATPKTGIETEHLRELVKATGSEAFFDIAPNRSVHILVPPDHMRLFKERIQKFEVMIPDVGR